MELKNGKITMLFSEDGLRIEVRDDTASVVFAKIKITPENTMAALSRLVNVPCEIEVFGLERLGKKMIHKSLEFEVPEDIAWDYDRQRKLEQLAKKACPDDWTPTYFFGSQNSIFDKDGKRFARTSIRKWIELEEVKS